MIRKLKKGTDHIGVCVVYFCHDGQGKFVMAKRNANARDEHGRWDIGGGAVELGQSVIETIHNEIKEEYCTNVRKIEFLGYRDVHRMHAGEKTHWLGLDFKVLVNSATVALGEPHKFDAVGWFTLETLPSPTHSQFPEFLRLYKSRLKKF